MFSGNYSKGPSRNIHTKQQQQSHILRWITLFTIMVLVSTSLLAGTQQVAYAATDGFASSSSDLSQEITSANSSGGTITLTADITLSGELPYITGNVTIDGDGYSISGANDYRVFYIESGTVILKNLTIKNGKAQGGDGAEGDDSKSADNGGGAGGGGGGAGLGGGLFVKDGDVTVENVTFSSNQAIGGNGGDGGNSGGVNGEGGGGGGMSSSGYDNHGGGPNGAGCDSYNGGFGGGGSGSCYKKINGGNGGFGGGGGGGYSYYWGQPQYDPYSGSFYYIYHTVGYPGGNGGFGGGGGGGACESHYIEDGGGGDGGYGGGRGGTAFTEGAGGGGGAGFGGAIFAMDGTTTLIDVTFSDNTTKGGQAGGGGLFTRSGQASGSDVYICNNQSILCGATVHACGSTSTSQVTGIFGNTCPPSIGNTSAEQLVNDNETLFPFEEVTINGDNNVSLSITLNDAEKGAFTSDSLSASGFSKEETEDSITYKLSSKTPELAQRSIQKLEFEPTPNQTAVDYFETINLTITAEDTNGYTITDDKTTVVIISVNDAPIFTSFRDVVDSTDEDPADPVEITFDELQEQGDEIDVDVDGSITGFVVQSIAPSSTLKLGTDVVSATLYVAGSNDTIDSDTNAYWIPPANANGDQDAFAVLAQDDQDALSVSSVITASDVISASDAITAQVSIAPINDHPTFRASNPPAVLEDIRSSIIITNWVTVFIPNSNDVNDETEQQVKAYSINDIVDSDKLLKNGPDITNDGDLSYELNPDVSGIVTFTVQVQDDGGTDNGGIDISDTQSFTLTVNDNDLAYVLGVDTPTIHEKSDDDDDEATVTFTITRTGAISVTSSITASITGTASYSTDYDTIGGTWGGKTLEDTVLFESSETTKTITLVVLDDTEAEANETIAVNLSDATAPDGYESIISNMYATTTITDDEDGGGDNSFGDEDEDGDDSESMIDSDEDGIINGDEDVDGDGNYRNDDTDSDGIPNYLDDDDDGDGIPSKFEDLNSDGNLFNDDSDNDSVPNYLESNTEDTDSDGVKNFMDSDDDGDGIPTKDEDINNDGSPTSDDTDGDGILNYLDTDDNNDGIPTNNENLTSDMDGDNIPDYCDPDVDGDGISNEAEDVNGNGIATDDDSDGDNIPDYLDSSNDGDELKFDMSCPAHVEIEEVLSCTINYSNTGTVEATSPIIGVTLPKIAIFNPNRSDSRWQESSQPVTSTIDSSPTITEVTYDYILALDNLAPNDSGSVDIAYTVKSTTSNSAKILVQAMIKGKFNETSWKQATAQKETLVKVVNHHYVFIPNVPRS